ncbi:transposase [Streptomyces sp. NPDC004042]|uniref:transposase n=1 Tax=Streptomyces sp. NPDC004042 TaxID=3154451 RepID=UPI0033B0D949
MTSPTCGNGYAANASACASPAKASSPARLGRRRWVIERTISWLSGYRRLSPRYERDPRNYLAFLGLAAAICCYKRLVRLTT